MGSALNIDQLLTAVWETVFMTFVSLFFASLFGLLIGILLYCTQSDGLLENRIINRIADVIVNILRAIPFLILLILLIPITRALVGTMLGAKAALPPLIAAATPFFARMCVIAFQEVDKGTIEASKAMGASNSQIILKVLLPESMPAIVSGIAVTGISLVGYTAMAGAIGGGGLGSIALMRGHARNQRLVLYVAVIILVVLVQIIQTIGTKLTIKTDKRINK